MKFNVGDKVRIKENLDECEFGYCSYMDAYKGKEAIVVKASGEGTINLDIDKQVWAWSENVLELIKENNMNTKIEEGNGVRMKRIDYILNSKDPIKVLVEEFNLEGNCCVCPGLNYDCEERCGYYLKQYLEQEIEVNKSDLKGVGAEPIDIGVEDADEQIDRKEVKEKVLDVVKEQLLKTKDKIIDMKEESVENDPVNPFMKEYKKIVTETMELCVAKNKDYGSSVQDTYEKFGDVSYLVRITDKYNRICSLLDKEAKVKDESIDDTIRDMANYCFLWLASRRLKEKGDKVDKEKKERLIYLRYLQNL